MLLNIRLLLLLLLLLQFLFLLSDTITPLVRRLSSAVTGAPPLVLVKKRTVPRENDRTTYIQYYYFLGFTRGVRLPSNSRVIRSDVPCFRI